MQTLRLFCDVARHGSFSRAAAEHGITQSAASQRIGQLERRLGVALLDRSVRPLTLTPAGELYLHEGRDLMDRYEDLERRVSQSRAELEGEVAVHAIYSAGIDLLNRVKESFEVRHPGVSVAVSYRQPEEVYDAVRRERCDLGIVSYPQTWREVGVLPLRDERMVVVCAPSHPLAARRSVRVSALAGEAMAAFPPDLPVARHIRKYLRDHGVSPEIASTFDNIDTVKAAVAVTRQVAILPRRTVMREAEAGTLAVVELEPRLARPVGIIYRKRRRHAAGGAAPGPFSAAARAFVHELLEHAGPKLDAPPQGPSQAPAPAPRAAQAPAAVMGGARS